ncbi:MAG: TatD family hydrolase, partial [Chloroflexi bacterium]|nr:TatD family hydrolase [Chloroflexota bacterium]
YWELIGDEPRINEELAAYKALGGGTLVDVTPIGIGRDLARLARLSEATGLHIVAGAGWYRQAYYPAEARIDRRSIDDLADEIVQEFVEGPVRPGIIGEIGTDKPWVTAQEERVFRAAARAALRTGASVTTHAVQSDVGLAQLAILEDEGLDPARIVIGHCDSHPRIEHWREIVRRGAHVFEKQILLSQDVCHDSQLTSYGGNGYTYLQKSFLPRLAAAGVNAATIKTITVENPARLLTLRKPA